MDSILEKLKTLGRITNLNENQGRFISTKKKTPNA